MHMATISRRLTVADLDLIPEEHEGDRQELIDGELIVTPVPIMKHQIVSMNIVSALDRHVRDQRLGWVFHAQTGIRFSSDNLLIPDIIFIAANRRHIFFGKKTIDAAPDLVVEILLPGTRRRDLTIKRDLYARFGVQEYWIVDPGAESVTVLALVNDRYEPVARDAEGRIVSRVLLGLALNLDKVFEGVGEAR
jgi:Uma2 family endonuclease